MTSIPTKRRSSRIPFLAFPLVSALASGCGPSTLPSVPGDAPPATEPPRDGAEPPRDGPDVDDGATGGARFLVRDGVASPEDAAAYAASLDVQADTIDAWRALVFGDVPVLETFYRNTSDLGFWRELTCTQTIDRGVGGCAVRNWAGPEDEAAGAANLGTVAMRMDAEGVVQFHAFGPDGARTDRAILDSEGEKLLPLACTSCHGGGAHIGEAGGLGSVFRELEPSLLEPPPGTSAAELEEVFYRFNAVIGAANRRVKTEAEGAPTGADHAADSVAGYINAMYAGGSTAHNVKDPVHMPSSWRGSSGAVEDIDARADLWTELVNPYCMGCHRTSDVDLRDYAWFSSLREPRDGVSELARLLALDHDDGTAVMPQAELSWTLLNEDLAARRALDRWLSVPSSASPAGE